MLTNTKHGQDMELWTRLCTSVHSCQLFTDHCGGRPLFLSSKIILLFYLIHSILSYFILFGKFGLVYLVQSQGTNLVP